MHVHDMNGRQRNSGDVHRVMKANTCRSTGLIVALAAAMFAAYARILQFPFIQDDWKWILRFQSESPPAILGSIFSIKGALFYRPLSELYLYAIYLLFGANPLPYHIFALIIHFASALLIIAIVRLVTRDQIVSYATGVIYAFAVSVHHECLLWAVGMYDLGGVFFFLLAMLLFLKGRTLWSAVAYLAGCFFKESVIVLPIILFFYEVIKGTQIGALRLDRLRRRLLPFAIALVIPVVVKITGTLPQSLPPSHPYVIDFFGHHVPRNLFYYAYCMVQAFDPFVNVHLWTIRILLCAIILFMFVCAWLVYRALKNANKTLAYWYFMIWFLAALLPVLFLPNHGYRYYAIYALPAFIAFMLTMIGIIVTAAGLGRRYERTVIVAITLLAVIFSSSQTHKMLGEGLSRNTLVDGTNDLIRKAAVVEIVHDGLMEYLPSPPHGAVIVLAGVDIWAFDKDSGPRAWYGDRSISVYPFESFRWDSTGAYIEDPIESQGQSYTGAATETRPVDPAKLFVFRLRATMLRPVKLLGTPESEE
jgi:hypothetical protein